MSAPIDKLLAKLSGVRQTGTGRWRARCPAHDSNGTTLSLREREDGAVLMHCFAGCSPAEVVSALGLDTSDLFPPRPQDDFVPGERRPFNAGDVLACLVSEVQVACVIARDVHTKRDVSDEDMARLLLAKQRLESGADMVKGYGR